MQIKKLFKSIDKCYKKYEAENFEEGFQSNTVDMARDFARKMPKGWPTPKVTTNSNGEICFHWHNGSENELFEITFANFGNILVNCIVEDLNYKADLCLIQDRIDFEDVIPEKLEAYLNKFLKL